MVENELTRLRLMVSGLVQGVGFRPFLYNLARELSLTGWVRNNFAGVELEIQGTPEALTAFREALSSRAPSAAVIDRIDLETVPVLTESGFTILSSEAGQLEGSPLPDQGICPACIAEFQNPHDRRYKYAFNSCTICGPRFTIMEALPFDRVRTSMERFELCPACRDEYTNPADRRFHAQTIACSDCGPELWFTTPAGERLNGDPAVQAGELLKSGAIIGIKGIGGYHLACDARNSQAVARLRQLKGRDNRAFAVMFRDIDALQDHCEVSSEELRALTGPARPIVLLLQKSSSSLSREVNPGLKELGAFLPYTGIQLLLFDATITALVMTSGNRSGEPLSTDNAEAVRDLGPMVAGFLSHNRPILWRCDDTVLRVAVGRVVGIRRSRGFVPAPFQGGRSLPPLLACGPQQKNTFALTKGERIYLSQHQGDLDNLPAYLGYQETITRLERLLNCKPEWVVHDLHPDYNSTIYARNTGLPAIGVQHHLAHLAGVTFAGAVKGPAIGVAFDGSGFGNDGRIWGGEFFAGEGCHWERLGHLEYTPLPGGEAAVREPWRMAVTYLRAANPEWAASWAGGQGLELPWAKLEAARQLGINHPETSSMGRLFDGIAVLCGAPHRVSYEGEAAIWLENQADPSEPGRYDWEIADSDGELIVRLAPLISGIYRQLKTGVKGSVISSRFHRTIAALTVAMVSRITVNSGINQVILSGGVFQNRLLLELTYAQLDAAGFRVIIPEILPINDGGVALGQAWFGALAILEGQ